MRSLITATAAALWLIVGFRAGEGSELADAASIETTPVVAAGMTQPAATQPAPHRPRVMPQGEALDDGRDSPRSQRRATARGAAATGGLGMALLCTVLAMSVVAYRRLGGSS